MGRESTYPTTPCHILLELNIVPGDATIINKFTLVINPQVIRGGRMDGMPAAEGDLITLSFIDVFDSPFPFTSTIPVADKIGAISNRHDLVYCCGRERTKK